MANIWSVTLSLDKKDKKNKEFLEYINEIKTVPKDNPDNIYIDFTKILWEDHEEIKEWAKFTWLYINNNEDDKIFISFDAKRHIPITKVESLISIKPIWKGNISISHEAEYWADCKLDKNNEIVVVKEYFLYIDIEFDDYEYLAQKFGKKKIYKKLRKQQRNPTTYTKKENVILFKQLDKYEANIKNKKELKSIYWEFYKWKKIDNLSHWRIARLLKLNMEKNNKTITLNDISF